MAMKKAGVILSANFCGQMVYREKTDEHDVIRWYEGAAKMEVPVGQFREELSKLKLDEEDPR